MRFLVRLLGGIWLATLVVSAGFAYLDVREERQRQMDALTRRATLVGSAVAEAAERLVTRGARTGYERVLTRFGTPDRGLAIYDAFGGVLGATVDVRPFLGPLSPLVSDAIHATTMRPAGRSTSRMQSSTIGRKRPESSSRTSFASPGDTSVTIPSGLPPSSSTRSISTRASGTYGGGRPCAWAS